MPFQLIPVAHAACDPSVAGLDLSECLILSDGSKVSDVYDSPATMINLIVNNLFTIAGIILFVMILLAGFKFISNDTKGKDEAKTIMTTAAVGFLLMFSAFWIVQIIKVVTGTDIPL